MADMATLVYEIDSTAARSAATDLAKLNDASARAAGGADKLNKSLRDSQGRFRSSLSVAKEYGSEVRGLAAKYNPALSAVYQFQQAQLELNRAVMLGVLTQQQADAALERTSAQIRSAAAASMQLGAAQKVTGQHTANVFAQLNDIGMMMAAGQNPFQLALQQGTSLNQVWDSMGAKGRSLSGVFGVLRGAVSSMISPMSLLTLGVIAGGAALVQWAFSAEDATTKTSALQTKVDEFGTSVNAVSTIAQNYSSSGLQSMVDKYGEVNAQILLMLERQREFAVNAAMADGIAAVRALGDEYTALNGSIDLFAKTGRGDFASLTSELGLNKEQVIALGRAYKDALSAQSPAELSAAITRMNAVLNVSNIRVDDLSKSLVDAEDAAVQLANSAPAASWMNAAISGVNALIGRLGVAIGEAAKLNLDAAGNPIIPGTSGVRPQAAPSGEGGIDWGLAPGGGGGGGGGGVDQAQAAWDALNAVQYSGVMKNLETLKWGLDQKLISEQEYNRRRSEMLMAEFGTEAEQNLVKFQTELATLNLQFEQKLIAEEAYLQRRSALQHAYYSEAIGVDQTAGSQMLSQMSSDFAQMNSLAGGGYDGLLRAQKAFAAGSALINAYLAASQAMADPTVPYWMKIAAYAKVLAAGMGAVNAIKGGGGSGGRGSAATSATAAAAPTKNILVNLTGPSFMVDMAEEIMTQIYEQSKDGRVIIARDVT